MEQINPDMYDYVLDEIKPVGGFRSRTFKKLAPQWLASLYKTHVQHTRNFVTTGVNVKFINDDLGPVIVLRDEFVHEANEVRHRAIDRDLLTKPIYSTATVVQLLGLLTNVIVSQRPMLLNTSERFEETYRNVLHPVIANNFYDYVHDDCHMSHRAAKGIMEAFSRIRKDTSMYSLAVAMMIIRGGGESSDPNVKLMRQVESDLRVFLPTWVKVHNLMSKMINCPRRNRTSSNILQEDVLE